MISFSEIHSAPLAAIGSDSAVPLGLNALTISECAKIITCEHKGHAVV
jgi:hypothetical protein